MSTPPRRLKDDPDFRWETGCDLADEAFAVGGYDLPSMRAKVLASVQPPSAGAPLRAARPWSLSATVGGALALLGLAGLAGLGLVGATDASVPVRPEAHVEEPTERRAAPSPGEEAQERSEPSASGMEHQDVSPTVPAAVPSAPPLPEASAVPAEGPQAARGEAHVPVEDLGGAPVSTTDGGAASIPEPASPPAADPTQPGDAPTSGGEGDGPPSSLAAEVERYDAATDRLGRGDAAGAVEAYEAYLRDYPEGRLVVESQLGLLRAQVALGPSESVEALAVRLLADARLASKHDELLRTRADNLVLMGRCDDALRVVRELPARAAAPIRRACRWKH